MPTTSFKFYGEINFSDIKDLFYVGDMGEEEEREQVMEKGYELYIEALVDEWDRLAVKHHDSLSWLFHLGEVYHEHGVELGEDFDAESVLDEAKANTTPYLEALGEAIAQVELGTAWNEEEAMIEALESVRTPKVERERLQALEGERELIATAIKSGQPLPEVDSGTVSICQMGEALKWCVLKEHDAGVNSFATVRLTEGVYEMDVSPDRASGDWAQLDPETITIAVVGALAKNG